MTMTALTDFIPATTSSVVADAHWRTRAACRHANPDLFADDRRSAAPPVRAVTAAEQFCRPCPVRSECRITADQLDRVTGVWAGDWRHSPSGLGRVTITPILDGPTETEER